MIKKTFSLLLISIVVIACILPVYASEIVPYGYIMPSGDNDYTPAPSDYTRLIAGNYYELVKDVNKTPFTLADIQSGTVLKFYDKYRNSSSYGYSLYYGNDTTNLVLVYSSNKEIPSTGVTDFNIFTLDDSVSITEVVDGHFYLCSYGNSVGIACYTAEISTPAGPVLELPANSNMSGITGRFYRLIDVDYADVLSGSKSVVSITNSPVVLIYTNSTTDVLGSFETVANLDAGVFTLSSSNAPSVTLQNGYLAVYFISDSADFSYRVKDVYVSEVNITVTDFSRFVLAPFFGTYGSYDIGSNYFQFAILALIGAGVVYIIIKYFLR